MAEMVSPGVFISETDLSLIATNDSQTTTVFAGNFVKGPLEKYVQITSVDELIETFGKPTNDNYNDWYQAYNFLQYASNLLVARACNINGNLTDTTSKFLDLDSLDGYGIQEWGSSTYGVASDAEWVFTAVNPNLKKGNIIVFGDDTSAMVNTKYPKFLVIGVNEGERLNNGVSEHVYGILLDRTPKKLVDDVATDVETNDLIYKIDISLNGVAEAVSYETTTKINPDWKQVKSANGKIYKSILDVPNFLNGTPYYNPELKNSVVTKVDVDTGEYVNETIPYFEVNVPEKSDETFLFENNIQIKNDDHFDLINPVIKMSLATSKLKFFSKTPGTEDAKYKICIALPSDFAVNDTRFIGNHCSRYAFEGVTLDGLFEYVPQTGTAQIAIVVLDGIEGEVKETFLCSLDPTEVDSYNNSMYVEDVINRNSKLVYVKDNVAVPALLTTTETVYKVDGTPEVIGQDANNNDVYRTRTVKVPNIASYTLVYDSVNNRYYGRTLEFSCAHDSSIQEDDLIDAYELFNNREDLDVDYIIGNELDNGSSALSLAEFRQDCMAYIGIPKEYKNKSVCIGERTNNATTNIVKFRNSVNYNTMWCGLCGNYKYQYDRYNDTYRWLNIAGDCVGLRAKCTVENDAWWASAGLDRGQIKNVIKLAYAPNQTQRGTLYTNGVNPVVTFPGEGTVLWGQKTMLSKSSSFNRINIRCLFNTIERALAKMSRYSVFEFNDSFTRNKVISTIKPYLAQVQAGRGIQDFKVVCDTSNNTAQIIAENKLVVDIYIKPTYVAEFIHLRFFNVGTNDFSAVVTE